MPNEKITNKKITGNFREKHSFSEFGIILKVVPLGEADGVVTLLTKHQGKFSALAKGLKRSQKRFMGGLNTFDSGTFSIEEAVGSKLLPILTGITHRVFFEGLGQNLEAFAVASLGIELVDSFSLERDPEGGLYLVELLEMLKTLNTISEANLGRSGAIALGSKFVARILTIAGFSDFDSKIEGQSEIKEWLKGKRNLLPLPPESDLKGLFSELIHSVELVTGNRLVVRPTLERILGVG
jgi:hypothetical protein